MSADLYARIDWLLDQDVPPATEPASKPGLPDRRTLDASRVRLVLLVLLRYANDDGESWPSLRTITQRAGLQWTRDASRALAALVTAGFIKDTGRRKGRATVVWQLLIPDGTSGVVRTVAGDGLSGVVRTSKPPTVRGDVRTTVRTDVRLSSGPPSGLVRTEDEGGRAKGEDAALTRADPPTESRPSLNTAAELSPRCPKHRDTDEDVPCHDCRRYRLAYERSVTERAAVTCRWDGCTQPRDPDSKNRYCTRHERRHQEG